MPLLCLKYLSEKQRQAWRFRYQYRWKLKRIALRFGMSKSGVSRMLAQARRYAGMPPKTRVSVIRTKPRQVRHTFYLSEVVEEV